MKRLLTALSTVLLLASCQKEISLDDSQNNGGGGTGGNTNGELLVKGLEISPATGDTTVITFDWDAGQRLLSYVAAGKVQGITTNIRHFITRAVDGKIKTIISKSAATTGFSDSTVYRYNYVSGSTKVAYILGLTSTILGDFTDSAVLTYNTSNRVISKEIFSDFMSGTPEFSSREEYEYDANGNMTKITTYSSDGNGGSDKNAETVYTYDAHKASLILGEESFAVIGAANVSKNNPIKVITNAVSSGTNYTGTFTQLQFNSFDRPTQGLLSVTPQPPGYNVKLLFYYK